MLVYKYRSGSKRDIDSLINNQFYSAGIETLNDIQEAKIKVNHTEIETFDLLMKNIIPNIDSSLKKNVENFINETKKFGIYSLSKNYNNELLWAYYCDAHKGFCIEYDLEILKQYQLNEEFFCDVEYQDHIPIINLEDISKDRILTTKLLSTKSKNWEHEDEYRIITGEVGVKYYFTHSVKSLYFGSRTNKDTIEKIMEKLKGRNIKYYQMTHKQDLYELERVEIENIYKNYSLYRDKKNIFQPIFDENTEPYKDLIIKAIIILEYEPVCKKVLDAYISSSKGTKENPVFYIMYKPNTLGVGTRNFFISKEEIENFIW